MSYIVFDKEKKQVRVKELKVTAVNIETGVKFSQYVYMNDLKETVDKFIANGFGVDKVEDVKFSKGEETRLNVVKEIFENTSDPIKWLGNTDALELFIKSGYVDPTSELTELKDKRNDWDATTFFKKEIEMVVKARRKEIEYGGLSFNGRQIDTNKDSQMRIAMMYNSKKELGNYNVVAFKAEDGFLELDMEELGALLKEVQKLIEACFRAEMVANEWIKALSLGQLHMYYTRKDDVIAKYDEFYNNIREVLK